MRGCLSALAAYVTAHLVGKLSEERLYLFRLALHEAFDPPVGQVANGAGYIVALSDTTGGVAKAHALDVSRKVNDALLIGHVDIVCTTQRSHQARLLRAGFHSDLEVQFR